MNGERYLGNTNKQEVHDLDNEKTGTNQCQIDEIIRAGNDKPFTTQRLTRPATTTATTGSVTPPAKRRRYHGPAPRAPPTNNSMLRAPPWLASLGEP